MASTRGTPASSGNSSRRATRRGVFCLESEWSSVVKKRFSIEPVLQLLKSLSPNIEYVHRDAATKEELYFYLNKWKQRQYASHPILYLAYHGAEGEIDTYNRQGTKSVVTIDNIEEILADACKKRIIHFGSCYTMAINGNRINRFLTRTGALAVCGFQQSVDPLMSAAFEVLALDALQQYSMTIQGANAMKRSISANTGKLARKLGFRMVVRKSNGRNHIA